MKKSLFALTILASTTIQAEQIKQTTTSGLLGFGLAFGGDKLYSAEFTDGDTASIKAGEGFWFDLGFRTEFEQWAVKATVGYKTDSVEASNGDVSFSNLPLTVIGQYLNGAHSFGAGISYHMNPKLSVDVPGDNFDLDFDNAAGLVLEYEKNQGNWGWGLRYTIIDYKLDVPQLDVKVDGNNIGLFANWYF